MAGPDLKKWREKLDTKVLAFIKKKAPNTRIMNLVHHSKVKIPKALMEDSILRNRWRSDTERKYMIIEASVRRLKRKGLIWSNKRGTPHWEAHHEDVD